MNISDEIYDYAKKRNLDWIATGGGCDYIERTFERTQMVLGAKESGESPDFLHAPSCVSIYTHRWAWEEGCVCIDFPSARKAMKFMASIPDKGLYGVGLPGTEVMPYEITLTGISAASEEEAHEMLSGAISGLSDAYDHGIRIKYKPNDKITQT